MWRSSCSAAIRKTMTLIVGVTGGIGLFIAFIGLQNSHLVVDGATLVSIYPFKASLASGEFYTTGIGALLALIGVILTAVLMIKNVLIIIT